VAGAEGKKRNEGDDDRRAQMGRMIPHPAAIPTTTLCFFCVDRT
jgi:hypothetical protein